MNGDEKNSDESLYRYLGRYSNPTDHQVESEVERAWQELQLQERRNPTSVSLGIVPQRSHRKAWRITAVAAVAAVVVLAVWIARNPTTPIATHGVVALAVDEVVRSGADVSVLALRDGSSVEMRPQSELVLEEATDGIRIRLIAGSLIVSASHQGSGHLYVRTHDVDVSVVGTVFMVSAREEGSRVAVIQGEVRVQQGDALKSLLPGDQMATGPMMAAIPVADEIAWSPSASVHLALLQQNVPGRVAPRDAPRFAATSIKLLDPMAPGVVEGFGCRGVDGRRLASSRERGEPSLVIPMGRCVGDGVFLSQLLAMAYGIPHRFGPNVPDWASRGTPTVLEGPSGAPGGSIMRMQTLIRAKFQVNATADDPARVTTAELSQMVQTMLAERFKLSARQVREAVPGYALSIGNTTPKLKTASGDASPLIVDDTNPGHPVLRGNATIDDFLLFLSGFSNPVGFVEGELPAYISNQTGLKGLYEWAFALPTDAVSGGGRGATPLGNPNPNAVFVFPGPARYAWRGPALAKAVEEQLGLRMLPQDVPVDVLVIDSVEKPTEN